MNKPKVYSRRTFTKRESSPDQSNPKRRKHSIDEPEPISPPTSSSSSKSASKFARHKHPSKKYSGPLSFPMDTDEVGPPVKKLRQNGNIARPASAHKSQEHANEHIPSEARHNLLEDMSDSATYSSNSDISDMDVEGSPHTAKLVANRMTVERLAELAFSRREYQSLDTPPPRKTLHGKAIDQASKQATVWSHNQAQSPLLRLPNDVRMQIYKHVLGSKTIMIEFENYRTMFEYGDEYFGDEYVVIEPRFRYRSNVINAPISPFRDDYPQGVTDQNGMTLLSGVCRQLHTETSVLPFRYNRIGFWIHNALFNFIAMDNCLSRYQRQEITQIYLSGDLPGSNLLERLPNLKHIGFLGDDGYEVYEVVRDGEEPTLKKCQPRPTWSIGKTLAINHPALEMFDDDLA